MQGDPLSDRNQDGVWDVEDLNDLVKSGWNSSLGDANLDGRFNSSDLVQVLSAGKYDAPLDSTWSEGDWNCDRRFTTHDFVVALSHGGYDVAAVAAAPPSSPSGLRPLNRAEMAAGRAWLLESVHRSKSGKIPRRGPARLAAAPVTHAVSQRPLLPPASVEQIFADPAEVLSPPSRAIGIYTSRIRPHPAPHPAFGHLLPAGEKEVARVLCTHAHTDGRKTSTQRRKTRRKTRPSKTSPFSPREKVPAGRMRAFSRREVSSNKRPDG